jgi:hypothetical protein
MDGAGGEKTLSLEREGAEALSRRILAPRSLARPRGESERTSRECRRYPFGFRKRRGEKKMARNKYHCFFPLRDDARDALGGFARIRRVPRGLP